MRWALVDASLSIKACVTNAERKRWGRDLRRTACIGPSTGTGTGTGTLALHMSKSEDGQDLPTLMKLNPGLKSRFPRCIEFPDYEPAELMEIAERMVREMNYRLHAGAREHLRTGPLAKKLPGEEGNARAVSNILEGAKCKAAVRVARLKQPTKDDVVTLIAADFQG